MAKNLEAIAHEMLRLGRLLLASGADTAEVQSAVARLAEGFAVQANIVVTYEALLLTLEADGAFRTKIGRHLPGLTVDLRAVERLNAVVDAAAAGHPSLEKLGARLDAIEGAHPGYPPAAVAVSIGLTSASLSRLFGGDWATFAVAFVAGAFGMLVRQTMGARHANPFLVPFVAALASGAVGGFGARWLATATPALCLVAPGMVIVPGVPLINGVRDAIANHMSLALARLGFASLILLAIAFGLAAATAATTVDIPVDQAGRLLPVWEDAIFSALAAIGYATLFNVPLRLVWACVLCGLVSHTLRTLLMHVGVDVVLGSFLGAAAVGLSSQVLAHRLRAPPAAFAFAGVVAMLPGSFAFRAVIGALRLVHDGVATPTPLVTLTVSLAITVALMTAAIAIGLAVPLAMVKRGAGQDGH